MKLPSLTPNHKLWIGGAAAVALFVFGWFSHKWFTKPVVQTVTVEVPVEVHGGTPGPQVTRPGGTVTPAVNYGKPADLPKPPDTAPGFNPDWVTTVFLPVTKPVRLFHSTDLVFHENSETLNIQANTRVWARYEDGEAVQGLQAETLFTTVKDYKLPLKVRVEQPKERPWAVGVKYNLNTTDWGAWMERDLLMFRFGADLDYVLENPLVSTDKTLHTTLRAGVRF